MRLSISAASYSLHFEGSALNREMLKALVQKQKDNGCAEIVSDSAEYWEYLAGGEKWFIVVEIRIFRSRERLPAMAEELWSILDGEAVPADPPSPENH